jgi:hypothetical protein
MSDQTMTVRKIPKERAKRMVFEYHYMKYLPQVNHEFLGGFLNGELAAVMTLGWGVRPRHTIQKCFPSLGTEDYRAIGRLVAVEELPQNTESHFISRCIDWIQDNLDIRVLYTWADGMLGKPGIIYQASNFWYGGYIWTDMYLTDDGERVHPRQTNRIGGRPSWDELTELGWTHYRGKQYRYVYFLDDGGEQLRHESEMDWRRREYPKEDDCAWKQKTSDGWEQCGKPAFDPESMAYNSDKGDAYRAHKEQVELGQVGKDRRFARHSGELETEVFKR